MDKVTQQLTTILKEKWIVKDILDMIYASDHKDRMENICNSINDMTCVVLNTVYTNNVPIQTHIIFHDKIDDCTTSEETIENYIFAFQSHEMNQYNYILKTIKNKGEIYLNKEEYLNLYNIELTSESEFVTNKED